MHKLDIVPTYIKIFDKYDNCRRFLKNSVGKSETELAGYYAVAIICYDIGMQTHKEVRDYMNPTIKTFFEALKKRMGGDTKIKLLAERYYTIWGRDSSLICVNLLIVSSNYL